MFQLLALKGCSPVQHAGSQASETEGKSVAVTVVADGRRVSSPS